MSNLELVRAIALGNIARLRAALAAGADVNAFKRVRAQTDCASVLKDLICSSLHVAVYLGRHEAVPILVAGGGDVNLRMPDRGDNSQHGVKNLTPLMLALCPNRTPEEKRRATVAALIAAGAEVDASVSPYDWTAFTSALNGGLRASLLELLRAGATIRRANAVRVPKNEDCFALVDKIDKAGGFASFAAAQRAVHVSILRKIFGAALPHDVLPFVASFWMPRGGF